MTAATNNISVVKVEITNLKKISSKTAVEPDIPDYLFPSCVLYVYFNYNDFNKNKKNYAYFVINKNEENNFISICKKYGYKYELMP